MSLTKNFTETVKARAEHDEAFREALAMEVQRSIRLSPKDWAAFLEQLDTSPTLHPRLARLLQEDGP